MLNASHTLHTRSSVFHFSAMGPAYLSSLLFISDFWIPLNFTIKSGKWLSRKCVDDFPENFKRCLWEITASLYSLFCPSFSNNSKQCCCPIVLADIFICILHLVWNSCLKVNKSRCSEDASHGVGLILSFPWHVLRWYSSVRSPVNGIVWPFPPSPACLGMHSGPWWLMSGQEEEKPIPRLQCGAGDGWFLGGLCRNERRRPEGWEEDRIDGEGWGPGCVYYRISSLYFYLCVFSLRAQRFCLH